MRPLSHESTVPNPHHLQKYFNDNVVQFLCVQKIRAHPVVAGRRVIIGVLITDIGLPSPTVDKELALTGPVLDLIKLHVDGFGSFLFYGVIIKTLGSELFYLHV